MNIAFFGPMCSGKSYMAKYLVDNYGYVRIGFSDKLKEIASDLFWINTNDKNGRNRKLLQEFSDDIKKWGGEDIFVKHFLHKISDNPFLPIVCDDLRYTFEAEALRDAGFTIVGVNCYENIRQERILKLYPDTPLELQQHRSETDSNLITPDYSIWSTAPSDVKQLEGIVSGKRAPISVRW